MIDQVTLAHARIGGVLDVHLPQMFETIFPHLPLIQCVPAFDAASSAENLSASPVSFPHVIGGLSDRIAVIGGHVRGSAGDLSADYDSVAATLVATAATGSIRSALFWMPEADLPGAGSFTCAVAFTGSVTHFIGSIMTYSGAEQSVDDSNTNIAGAVTSISTSVDPTVGMSAGMDICGVQDAGSITIFTPTSGQTQRYTETDFDADATGGDEIPIGPAANTHSYSFNGTSQAAIIVAVAFGPAPATVGSNGFIAHNF